MDETTKNSFEYPIICFGKEVIAFFRNDSDLTVCTKKGKLYFENAKIVDSKGDSFSIIAIHKVGTVGPFFGFDIFLNQRIKIKLQFKKDAKSLQLDEFKEKLLRHIWGNKDNWDSDGEINSRIKFIRNALTIAEIIKKMTFEYFKSY
ncbi:MAG: hypothetical protein V4665_01070 [Patescibacteria group bacterium]